MPSSIENYVPQTSYESRKQQAFWVWGAVLFVALIWVSLTVSAPLAQAGGIQAVSRPLYDFFGYLCHQMPERSFHVFDRPLAVCARCFGFYGGLLLGIAIYPLFRPPHDTNPFARFWLFLAMIPMAIDWSLTFFDVWENTHFSRAATGAILGAACAFFIIPALVEINFLRQGKLQKS